MERLAPTPRVTPEPSQPFRILPGRPPHAEDTLPVPNVGDHVDANAADRGSRNLIVNSS